MRVTIKDVACEAGVSVAAVSMALNHRDGVSVATKEKVLKAAKALNYIPNYFWHVSTKLDTGFSRSQYRGYIREAGLAQRKERVLYVDAPLYDETYEAADRIVRSLSEAIICINDIMSIAIRPVRAGGNDARQILYRFPGAHRS